MEIHLLAFKLKNRDDGSPFDEENPIMDVYLGKTFHSDGMCNIKGLEEYIVHSVDEIYEFDWNAIESLDKESVITANMIYRLVKYNDADGYMWFLI